MEITTEECRVVDTNIPQWKRDLILRRRAVGRVLPTGNGSVQLTCPSVVAAVRLAEYSISSDFHRSCESEREQTSGYKNMRLFEQVDTSDDFVEPCVVLGIKEIITKIEGSTKELKMGEEKNGKKKYNSPLICDKKSNELNGVDDDSASDSSEEFKYGPGIVSKLKSKYLSLTLRESQGKVRPSLDSLRRATSLENILNDSEPEKSGEYKTNYLKNIQPVVNGSAIVRCRGLSRSNKESMKRARSVEVLTRYCDRGNIVNGRRSLDTSLKDFENENDEKRNARNRINSLSVEEKELPPPDLVKHTLKIFEKSQNMKNSFSVKKKNQKKVPDSVCAKKPVISPKPFLQKRNNEKIDSRNSPSSITSTEIVNGSSANDITKNYFLDKNSIKNVENSSENVLVSSPASDFSGTILKKKASLCNENSCESVINKISSNDSVAKSVLQNDNIEKDLPSSPMSKNGLELDLTDLAISPINTQRASPKTNSERAISDSLESKRCISPVLVRAPPSIISTELSCTNSPTQHMKQVGVIRPIVTNKVVQSNMTKQQINKPLLTEREIEKNLINKVKCTEQPVTKVIVSLKKSPEECFLSETTKPNEGVKKGQLWDKKPNTMVFNFSNRKTVPDYIENDGLILAPRKEKPKLGEPGMIHLSGGTEESTTDFDLEEFTSDPPSPCNIDFEGDNILINGRSNIQSKPKLRKMKIQFNDEATTLYEYPSEASLLDDQENAKSDLEVTSTGGSSPGLPIPFRCGNLGSYTPSNLSLSTDFQLGITKTAPPPSPPKPVKQEEEEDEEKEENYLRPADENSTSPWSSETAADLLF